MKKSIRTFPALLLAGSLSAATALAADDPFVRGKGEELPQGDNRPKFVSVCFETFSLEMAEAAALYHDQPNDTALYKEVTARVAKGKARQESFSLVRARSGERAILKSTSESIYPASYLPGARADENKQPAPVRGAPPKPAAPAAAPTTPPSPPPTSALPFPTDFKTRDVGITLEIEPTIAMNDRLIDLRITPTFVTSVNRTKWGPVESGIETPGFEVQQVVTSASVLSERPYFLGTMSRPTDSKADPDSADRVWFAFARSKVITVAEER
ncbi:MAG TPA: hypothetical protein VGE67_13495 [Haloferula sp.]